MNMRSSITIQNEHGRQQNGKPEWLDSFLQTPFFSSCSIHDAPKNELNKYCIDCQMPACLHCIDARSHAGHQVLKTYKYATNSAVPRKEFKRHVDCSKIQAYKCNKHLVIPLTLPDHSSSEKNEKAACAICMRKLMNPTANRYCCLSCKVQAFSAKTDVLEPPFLAVRQPSDKRKVKRTRKGVPSRASNP